MTEAEFAGFIDEITSLRDRFDKAAAKTTPDGIAPQVRLLKFRLAALESVLARPSFAGLPLKGRKPERRRAAR
jgi:hypothetical protein